MIKNAQHPENLTGIEIMHHVLLWCYNWTEEDFKEAFKDSRLGWDYFWNKLQGKLSNDRDPTEAIVDVILNMDKPHQQMLFDYIFAKKAKTIESSREWAIKIEKALAKQKAKRIIK